MKIVVTGGAGFIGSALIRYLIRQTTASVVNVDSLTYAANLDSLREVEHSDRYSFEQVDICDAPSMTRVLSTHQPDAVMNLAAESHVDRSIDGPAAFIRTNLVGTYELLEAVRAYRDQLPEARADSFRLLHVSTDEVFGDLDQETDDRFSESTPYAPSSPYAATKAGSDHLVRAWGRTFGLPILITNCSNNYGPYQFPEKLIPHVILNALSNKPIPVYGKGDQIRDWLHVEDHATALYTVLTQGQIGETYNIGSNNERRNIDVIEKLCDTLEASGEKPAGGGSFTDLITYVTDRPGHDARYAIDPAKVTGQLGWEPQVAFDSGLTDTVRWYLDNRSWWQRVLAGQYKLERLGGEQQAP